MKRIPIDKSLRDMVLWELSQMLEKRVKEKGDGAFSSLHEMRGVISEEYDELMEAFHQKDPDQIEHELLDLGVAVLFSYACLRNRQFPEKKI